MHDASEAYLVDIPSPIKAKLANYREIEDSLMSALAKKFNFEWPLPKEVKDADRTMLKWEWEQLHIDKLCAILMCTENFYCYEPKRAKKVFLAEYNKLKGM